MTIKRVVQVSLAMWLGALCAGTASAQDQRQIEERKAMERLREAAVKMRQAAEQAKRQPAGSQSATRGFSVVLVLGDLQGPSSTANNNVPEAARKALEDMKEFLPYKSYRLLDAAWILGDGQSTSPLRGVDDHPYTLVLNAVRLPGARGRQEGLLQMRVRLEETEGGQPPQQGDLLNKLRRATELNNRGLIPKADVETLTEQLKLRAILGRPVVATSFSMDAGETVIVGTSRVNGDKALILLLTAVPGGSAGGAQPLRE